MKGIRIASLVCNLLATIGLTICAALHEPLIYTVGVFSMGMAGSLALISLIKGEQK